MSSSNEFQIGEPVNIRSLNLVCNIDKELGSGTQGKVYSLICPDNTCLVLKWYFPSMATSEQLDILNSLIQKKSPSDRFLWPLALVELPEKSGFGYIMELKNPRFKSFSLWLSRKVDPSFRILLTACFELANSFHLLHSKGLCYRDLSLNNIYFDPLTGEIRIGDTDNIVINGESKGNVIGTPKFMAPEVITGKALPNTESDLFSLAVILFYVLFLNHPLEGRKESMIKSLDLPAMTKLYGYEPLFIFDPKDKSNYPDPEYHQNALIFWNIYPSFLKKMFVKAFTDGIHDYAYGRVRETEWQMAISLLMDLICKCPNCGSENFYMISELISNTSSAIDRHEETLSHTRNCSALGNLNTNYVIEISKMEMRNQDQNNPQRCWNNNCKSLLIKQLYIKLDQKIFLVLNSDTVIYKHHIDPNNRYDYSNPVGQVAKHPNNPEIWGLKNISDKTWKVITANNQLLDVFPQKSFSLVPGTKINFGNSGGIICY